MRNISKTLAGAAITLCLGVSLNASAGAPVDKKIERVWKSKCASCHGADRKGATEQGGKMKGGDYSSAAWQKGITDDKIKAAINDGTKIEKDGVKKEMDAYKDTLKPDQVDGLVAFLRSLGGA